MSKYFRMRMTATATATSVLPDAPLDPLLLRPNVMDMFPAEAFLCQPGATARDAVSIRDTFYHVGSQPEPRLPLDVCLAGTSQWQPGTRVERSTSYATGLTFIAAGMGLFETDRTSCELLPGDVLVLHRGERSVMRAAPPDLFVRMHMTFWPGGVTDLFARMGLDRLSHVRPAPEQAAHLRAAFERLNDVARARTADYRAELSRISYDMLLTINAAAYGATPVERVPEFLAGALRRVYAAPATITNIAQLARLAACSVSHLHRLFTRFIGMSPHHWLELTRMRKAAEHLCLTNMTINQIADQFGYADPFHFSKVFKRVTGVAPSQYRARYRPGR
jgi:AraC-like DNA-binding protein